MRISLVLSDFLTEYKIFPTARLCSYIFTQASLSCSIHKTPASAPSVRYTGTSC